LAIRHTDHFAIDALEMTGWALIDTDRSDGAEIAFSLTVAARTGRRVVVVLGQVTTADLQVVISVGFVGPALGVAVITDDEPRPVADRSTTAIMEDGSAQGVANAKRHGQFVAVLQNGLTIDDLERVVVIIIDLSVSQHDCLL
jgi:hypothetical protein